MKRKIYNELLKWKETSIDTPLMVIGARQIGKTYIINEFCKNEFKNYIYINLLDNPKIVELFEQSISTEEKFTQLQWILNTDIDLNSTIIFFDEIFKRYDAFKFQLGFNFSPNVQAVAWGIKF